MKKTFNLAKIKMRSTAFLFLVPAFAAFGCDRKEISPPIGHSPTRTQLSKTSPDNPVRTSTNSDGTAQMPAPTSPVEVAYAMGEVAKHNVKTDCWIVLNRGVYDITAWFADHPGGDSPLRFCGKDATAAFDRIGHSEDAIAIREQFRIGILAE